MILPPVAVTADVVLGGTVHSYRAQQEHGLSWFWEHVQVMSRWQRRPMSCAKVRLARRAWARGGLRQASRLQDWHLRSQTAHMARVLMFDEAFHPIKLTSSARQKEDLNHLITMSQTKRKNIRQTVQ